MGYIIVLFLFGLMVGVFFVGIIGGGGGLVGDVVGVMLYYYGIWYLFWVNIFW